MVALLCGYLRNSNPYPLSKTGQARFAQLHPSLQAIVQELLYYKDISVICSFRSREEQEEAFRKGTSKAHFGQSAHNFLPSRAVDIVPYPIPMKNNQWDNNSNQWNEVANLFLEIAKQKGIEITWGGTFKTLTDKPHFELTAWRKM